MSFLSYGAAVGLTVKTRKGKQYLYFKAGRTGTHYIGPRDSSTSIKLGNVEKSLSNLQKSLYNDTLKVASMKFRKSKDPFRDVFIEAVKAHLDSVEK